MQISPPAPILLKGDMISTPALICGQPLAPRRLAPNWSFVFIAVCCGLDPDHFSRDIYNRYAPFFFELPRAGERTASFKLEGADWYRAFVSPFDPVMRDVGLKYVVFPRVLTSEEMGQ